MLRITSKKKDTFRIAGGFPDDPSPPEGRSMQRSHQPQTFPQMIVETCNEIAKNLDFIKKNSLLGNQDNVLRATDIIRYKLTQIESMMQNYASGLRR
jgi:hypothetical protein